MTESTGVLRPRRSTFERRYPPRIPPRRGVDFLNWSRIEPVPWPMIGADWMKSMSNTTLTRIFGSILVLFGTRMLWLGKA